MNNTPTRFLALDVFRGLTVCLMIIVNTPGDGNTSFAPLHHARWNGFTPTDLVFPSFLFAVGNSISFVMPKWLKMPQSQVLWKLFKRSAVIFLLGFLMYWFPFVKYGADGELVFTAFSETRVFGVLQRIALCYLFGGLLVFFLKPRALWWITILLPVIYWILLLIFGDSINPLSLEGNAVLKLDHWLLGDKHLYHGDGIAFDPEGLLSTLPAISNVIAGYLAGRYIQQKGSDYQGLTVLLIAGILLVFAGYCWSLGFPLNKKLWTGSFVVYTTGLDCIILGVIIYVIHFRKQTGWTYFFQVFGRNTLFIYLLSEVVAILLYFIRVNADTTAFQWIYLNCFRWMGPYSGSLVFSICFMLLCWAVGYMLDKRKIYIKV